MEIMIKCKSLEHTYCPKCASKLRLSKDNRTGHCGHCGSVVTVDVPEQASIQNIAAFGGICK